MAELRDYQQQAIDDLRQALREGSRRPMLQAPTGAGKTVIAGDITLNALRRGKRVIFTVPRLSLIDQTVERFWDANIRAVGVMQGMHPQTDPDQPIQVCSVQTLARRKIPAADLVIVDEAHMIHKSLLNWMSDPDWARTPFIGLSATPWARGLGKYWDRLVHTTTTQALIDNGTLSAFRVFAPTKPDLSKIKTVAGDYHEGQLADEMAKDEIVADVVKTWLERAQGRPTILFAVNRAHAGLLQQRFLEAGVRAGYIDGFTERPERQQLEADFKSGAIQVACSVGTLTTGVDWDVRCIILARPTKSEMLYVQMIGRGLRSAPGKDHCLILDHTNTTLKLGFVTEIDKGELDDGKPKLTEGTEKKEALPKECSKCGCLRPPKVRKCLNCGFEAMAQCEVEERKGELVELRPKDKRMPKLRDMFGAESLYGQLRWLQEYHGYRPGWIMANYKEITGAWPRFKTASPVTPSADLMRYIEAKRIRNAKSYGRQRA